MKTVQTEGGWMWYVNQVKTNSGLPIADYKELMKNYMASKRWEKVVEEMKNVSN